jgi:hypothetical protein
MKPTPLEAQEHVADLMPLALYEIRGLIGGINDPLPPAAQPPVAKCDDCGRDEWFLTPRSLSAQRRGTASSRNKPQTTRS